MILKLNLLHENDELHNEPINERGDGMEEDTDSGLAGNLRIRDLVDATGVSKDLIHHYLRQGILPPCETRARYGETHLQLLHLVRKLRDEFHLPLDTVRRIFELYGFDPEWLQPLFHIESLAQRLSRFAESSDLGLGRTLSADELAADAGIDVARLEELIGQQVIRPLEGTTPPRFTPHDAHVAALCDEGTRLGIPFASFRTVASYVRVGFELEHREFIELDWEAAGSPERLLGQAFVRREITSSFVHNVLQSLLQRALHGRLELRSAPAGVLTTVVYRPSAAFRARFDLQAAVDEHRQLLASRNDDPAVWRQAAQLHLHAGSYREAAFTLEQGLEAVPGNRTLRALYGISLVLAGELDQGIEQLESLGALADRSPDTAVYLALARYTRSAEGGKGSAGDAAAIRSLTDGALDAWDPGAQPSHVGYLAAWLLTALPEAFCDRERGIQALEAQLSRLMAAPPASPGLPGLAERHQLNAAWLLFEALGRGALDEGTEARRADLRSVICQLDPASALAERAYLEARGPKQVTTGP